MTRLCIWYEDEAQAKRVLERLASLIVKAGKPIKRPGAQYWRLYVWLERKT